jgi:hypothetical protein
MNTVNRIISKLITGTQPDADPGKTAWTWFGAYVDPQPTQADDYIKTQLVAGMACSTTAYEPNEGNWITWSGALTTNLSGATGDVRKWLDTVYVAIAADAPTVPDDVITWTRSNLPTGAAGIAVVKPQTQTTRR